MLVSKLTDQGGGPLDRDSERRAGELTVATSSVATEVGLLLRELDGSDQGQAAGTPDVRPVVEKLRRQNEKAVELARRADEDLPSDAPQRDSLVTANRRLSEAGKDVVDSVGRGGSDNSSARRAPSPARIRAAVIEVTDVSRDVTGVAESLQLDDAPELKAELQKARGQLLRADVDVRREANGTFTGASEDSLAGSEVAGLGDVDGDGRPDVGVAAQGEGTVYVVTGEELKGDGELGDRGFAITSLPVPPDLESEGVPLIYDGILDVEPAGDLNGDGLPDVIIGAGSVDDDRGAAYVIFGSRSPSDVDVGALGSRGFTITGPAPFWRAGTSVSGIGDANGDGRDDIAIGGRRQLGKGGFTAVMGNAVTWVLHGGPDRDDLQLPADGAPPDGSSIDGIGDSLARVGDVNGDGIADIAGGDANNRMGIPGYGAVVFGRREPRPAVDVTEPGDWGIGLTTRQGRVMGGFVSGAGDQNADGLADLAVGSYAFASGADEIEPFPEPRVDVVYGQRSPGTVQLASLDSNGARLEGVGPGVTNPGDVNGDSVNDLVVETTTQAIGPPIGGARVVFGRDELMPRETDVLAARSGGFDLDGAGIAAPVGEGTGGGRFGSIVAGADDIDGDGGDDLVLGAPYDGVPDEQGTATRGTTFLVLAEPAPKEDSPIAGTVGPAGLGSIRVGSPTSAAERDLGTQVVSQLDTCAFLPTEDARVSFLTDADTVARVDVNAPGYATEAGVEVGDTEAAVLAAYGKRVRRTDHEYAPGGSYLTVRIPSGGLREPQIVFETDGEAVTFIRAGRSPEVGFVEGCA